MLHKLFGMIDLQYYIFTHKCNFPNVLSFTHCRLILNLIFYLFILMQVSEHSAHL